MGIMGISSIWHWIVVLVIVLVIFGTKRLRNIGGDLGSAIKEFKEGMKGEDEKLASPEKIDTVETKEKADS